MMYELPHPEAPLDQGDIVEACSLANVTQHLPRKAQESAQEPEVRCVLSRVVVMTQTCDFANQKADDAVVCQIYDARRLVEANVIKASQIRRPIRRGMVFGWYFLPRSDEHSLPESIVDLRKVYTVRIEILEALCAAGHRIAHIKPLYREHLSKHFADTYSRIGLPEPYETDED